MRVGYIIGLEGQLLPVQSDCSGFEKFDQCVHVRDVQQVPRPVCQKLFNSPAVSWGYAGVEECPLPCLRALGRSASVPFPFSVSRSPRPVYQSPPFPALTLRGVAVERVFLSLSVPRVASN